VHRQHERVLQQHKVKAEAIQTAVRIASVVKAVATVHATL
jgi:alkyl hydroperoxide reductase subunit D